MKKNKINDEATNRAAIALSGYADIPEDGVVDLLSDLRHYCKKQSIDFEYALEVSLLHFVAESVPPVS